MPRLRQCRSINMILHNVPVRSVQTLEERQTLCDYIGYSSHPDLRMQVWNIQALPQEDFAVTGCVSNPFALKALQKAAEECRATCDISRVKTLPFPDLQEKPFGLVTSKECPLLDSEKPSEQMDAAVYGRVLILLKRNANYTLVHSPNGYVGWVENTHYRQITEEEWYEKLHLDAALFLMDYEKNGVFIPQGAEIPVSATGELILPTGSGIPLSKEDHQYVITKSHDQREALLAVAKSLLGTPYIWGGVSKYGIDCSGFTRYVYHSIGILLPRDADQQFLTGRICAVPGKMEGLRSGDLLFFSGDYGGISHIAMAIDAQTFIHAGTQPGVVITSWDMEPRLFGKFMLAKRILR